MGGVGFRILEDAILAGFVGGTLDGRAIALERLCCDAAYLYAVAYSQPFYLIISLTGSRAVASLANATPRQGSCGACDHAPKIINIIINICAIQIP